MNIILYNYLLTSILLRCAWVWWIWQAALVVSAQPNIEFSGVPQILIGGKYNGISKYDGVLRGDRESFDGRATSVFLTQLPNGTFQFEGSTSPGGTINAMCIIPRSNDDIYNIDVYVAGNFSSIGNETSGINNIALYNPKNQTFSPLLDGLDSTVYTLYCDAKNKIVYAGGDFLAPVNPTAHGINGTSFGGSVALWQDGTWKTLPFNGFNGPVYVITNNEQNNTIYFGGRFSATGDGSFGVSNNTQPINIKNATIVGGSSTTLNGFSDPSVMVCSGDLDGPGNTWLLQDRMPGFWRAGFDIGLTPTSIGLRNTNYQGRGTKSFRLLSSPDQSVVPLTYVNSTTGNVENCSSTCPLDSNNRVYQIFNFDGPFNLTGFEIDILEWYGEGGGLHGIQLFQTDIVVRAANDLGFPSCLNIPFSPSVKTEGNWTSRLLSGIWEYVLSTTIPASQLTSSTAKVTLIPYIPESGYYNVTLFTPSCLPIGCSSTTSIDVKITVMPNVTITVTLAENSTDEYREDAIYSGYIVSTSNAFQPRVEITVSRTAQPPADGGDAVIYVDRVLFKPTNISHNTLSGLLQYTPSSSDVQASWYGLHGTLALGATVSDIAVLSPSDIIVGGRFENMTFSNIVQYDGSNFISLPNEGLNGHVNAVLQVGDDLIVGGLFNGTTLSNINGLNNLAIFDTKKKSWRAMGGGVNGEVTRLGLVNKYNSSQVHVIGRFNTLISEHNATFGNVTFGHAVWDDSINNWVTSAYVEGLVGSVIPYSLPNTQPVISFWGGNIISALSVTSFGGSLITSSGIKPLPIFPQSNAPEVIINAAIIYNSTDSSKSYVIVGGKFKLDNLTNIAILKDNVWNTVSLDVIEVRAFAVFNNVLYIGSAVNGSLDTNPAFASYDLTNFKMIRTQQLFANDNLVRVNIIKSRVGTDDLIVTGKFEKAGSLDCKSICLWDSKKEQWRSLSNNGILGEVLSIDFIGNDNSQNTLVAAGNLTLDNRFVYLAQYDFTNASWKEKASLGDGDTQLPGPATVVLNDFLINGQFFVAGYRSNGSGSYLRKWDGSRYRDISKGLLTNSTISQLSLVPSDSQHKSSDILDAGWLLLIAGDLALESYGNVSAAFYDGSTLYPYLISAGGNGTSGKIFTIFTAILPDFLSGHGALPVPLVILISVSISLAFIFLLVATGMSVVYFRRRRVAKDRTSSRYSDKMTIRQSELMNTINAATAIIGQRNDPRQSVVSSNFGNISDTKTSTHQSSTARSNPIDTIPERTRNSDNSDLVLAREMAEKIATEDEVKDIPAVVNNEEGGGSKSRGRVYEGGEMYHARFPFVAREDVELGFEVGDIIYVTDKSDDVWWKGVKDDGTGNFVTGYFPSTYVVPDAES
ncbi:11795_t:CDS:2 [Acaulospora morrowiae]|uniref:11795_t:CDS:1 n=1 Tax=Acaulospora morrowiae TaxID=94023 RepID=A0A9N8ZQ11_9GLOM|nr:11795_t:CDS:2 [Acaulospora morrowiae]